MSATGPVVQTTLIGYSPANWLAEVADAAWSAAGISHRNRREQRQYVT